MKEKIICWVGAVLLAILSVLTVVFFTDDLLLSVSILAYYPICLVMLIGVDFKLKPYEWLLFAASMLVISIILVCNVSVLYTLIPLTVACILMIIIRICKKEKFGRLFLMLLIEILCGFFVSSVGIIYKESNIIESLDYKQEVINDLQVGNEHFDLVKFESSDVRYTIDKGKTDLLRKTDTVYVKTYEGHIHRIKRKP
ncbi:MAG: hypothetical protein E7016_01480 [Alphaproteobacteria bacterium]|nr:hypothetical protein [Alphaproteobacteria bacterium]